MVAIAPVMTPVKFPEDTVEKNRLWYVCICGRYSVVVFGLRLPIGWYPPLAHLEFGVAQTAVGDSRVAQPSKQATLSSQLSCSEHPNDATSRGRLRRQRPRATAPPTGSGQ